LFPIYLVAEKRRRKRAAAMSRTLLRLTDQVGNSLLHLFEALELRETREPKASQLFITGLPRTGSTLVSQYIAHRLDLAYFTNGVGRFPLTPCTISRWQRWTHPPYQSDFHSDYGRNKGPMAPREAGAFWGYYFDVNRYQESDDVPARNLEIVRRTIWRMQNIFADAPFMNKNVKHLLRLTTLARLFPDSHFLIIQRSLQDVAISVLIGRRKLNPEGSAWFSIVPRCYENIRNLPIVEQIPRQLIDIQEKMEEDLGQIDPARILHVPYSEFCRAPETLISEIKIRYPGTREKNPAMTSFPESQHRPTNKEQEQMVGILNELIARRSASENRSPASIHRQPEREEH
jgi:hypothetical protein